MKTITFQSRLVPMPLHFASTALPSDNHKEKTPEIAESKKGYLKRQIEKYKNKIEKYGFWAFTAMLVGHLAPLAFFPTFFGTKVKLESIDTFDQFKQKVADPLQTMQPDDYTIITDTVNGTPRIVIEKK